jgi:hypothetical protein
MGALSTSGMGFSGTKSMRRSRQAGESEDLPGEGFLALLRVGVWGAFVIFRLLNELF